MSRYLKTYAKFVTSSIVRDFEFRINFIAKVGQNLAWVGFFLIFLLGIYRNVPSIAGWNRSQGLTLGAVMFLLEGLWTGVFQSLNEIPQNVRTGTLDYILTKPIDSQFYVSVRRFSFAPIGTIIFSIALTIYGAYMNSPHPSVIQWFAYVASLGVSVALFYSLNLFLMSTAIWFVRVDNLWILGETTMQVSRYPIDIFPALVQKFFLFAVPLAFLAWVPAKQLLFGFDLKLFELGFLWAAIALIISRAFWKYATSHYSSASS